jgi:hypothetical protein
MKYILMHTDGRTEDISADAPFSLKKLQMYVGGLIQEVPFPDGSHLICNDEGRLVGLPINPQATRLWEEQYPLDKYPIANAGYIVGDVIHAIPERKH